MAFGLGAGTALMGKRAAMACTEAVETVIGEHYNECVSVSLLSEFSYLTADFAAPQTTKTAQEGFPRPPLDPLAREDSYRIPRRRTRAPRHGRRQRVAAGAGVCAVECGHCGRLSVGDQDDGEDLRPDASRGGRRGDLITCSPPVVHDHVQTFLPSPASCQSLVFTPLCCDLLFPSSLEPFFASATTHSHRCTRSARRQSFF